MDLRRGEIDHLPFGSKAVLQVAIEHLGGAMMNTPSLWKHRDAKVLISIEGGLLMPPARRETHHPVKLIDSLKRWLETVYSSLSPYFSGSYANYAYPEMQSWEEKYYGMDAYNKLVKDRKSVV